MKNDGWDDSGAVAAGGAEVESRTNSLRRLVNEGFFNGCYWVCDRGHRFNKNVVSAPFECPGCRSNKMVRWVPGQQIPQPEIVKLPEDVAV